ncbi:MAG TPA: cyclic nucleotide-binding domain-containing protein [Gaiellaceae bacterium]|jgi:CRP-like cAMP-binding protein
MALFSHDTKAEALGRTPLFAGLRKKDLSSLARLTEDMEVGDGKVLCREGELGREFFVIVEGDASVAKDGSEIGTLSGGDFFGEIALVENRPRTATVTAKGELRFFVLTSQAFWGLLDNQPEVAREVLLVLARRVARESDDPTG